MVACYLCVNLKCANRLAIDAPPTTLSLLQANFYHCGAYGTPITNNNGGPDPIGCTMGQYSTAVHNIFVELASDEMDHVTAIQTYLGTARQRT